MNHESDTTGFQVACYQFVNGIGSNAAIVFELSIYFLIAVTVVIGVVQTVEGFEDALTFIEWCAVIIFTIEYTIRFIGAGADPEFSSSDGSSNGIVARIKFLFSFYSIVDLLAILPFYLAIFMPNSWVDNHDEYL